jgi:hypothetical protein
LNLKKSFIENNQKTSPYFFKSKTQIAGEGKEGGRIKKKTQKNSLEFYLEEYRRVERVE